MFLEELHRKTSHYNRRTHTEVLESTPFKFPSLLVAVGDRHPGNRSGVTAQEEERDVAGGGHQVDQHGHADGAQS